MSPLFDLVADQIRSSGPITFARYMELALYHPHHGYYSTNARTGWRGHFVTSPEIDPAFGALWARAFERIWAGCDFPDDFAIVEVGPGEGAFAAAVLDAVPDRFASRLSYVLVEPSPAAQDRQRGRLGGCKGVRWAGSMAEVPRAAHTCVFGNEVLDNQPVHLIEGREGGPVELFVGLDTKGALVLDPGPPSDAAESALPATPANLPPGHRVEVSPAAIHLAGRAARLVEAGAVVFVDYGDSAAALLERPSGTLACYSRAGVDDLPLAAPGTKDITAHVNWTAVGDALRTGGMTLAGPIPQRRILANLGLHDLHASLRAQADRAAAVGAGRDLIRAVSRRQALGVLADPGGLGGLGVLAGIRGIQVPDFLERDEGPASQDRPLGRAVG